MVHFLGKGCAAPPAPKPYEPVRFTAARPTPRTRLRKGLRAACSLLASTPKLNLALLTISGTSSKGCCGLGRTHYADMADTSVIARFLDAARTGRVDGTGKQHGSGLGCVGTGLHIDADNEDEIALAFESVAQQMGGEGITEVL